MTAIPRAMAVLGNGLHALQSISGYSGEIKEIAEEFADMYYRFEDISASLRTIREKITFTPEELDVTIARQNLIDNLKKRNTVLLLKKYWLTAIRFQRRTESNRKLRRSKDASIGGNSRSAKSSFRKSGSVIRRKKRKRPPS